MSLETEFVLRDVRVAILVASDSGASGKRADQSGEWLAARFVELGATVLERQVIPDDRGALAAQMRRLSDETGVDLLFTCGGTGFTGRDVTPEATLDVVERMVPGIAEAIRAGSLRITPMAMLSRGVAGIRGKTLIVNLPGSPKAVRETLEIVLPVLPHAVQTLRSVTGVECGGRNETQRG